MLNLAPVSKGSLFELRPRLWSLDTSYEVFKNKQRGNRLVTYIGKKCIALPLVCHIRRVC
jgi:hypothetical protein